MAGESPIGQQPANFKPEGGTPRKDNCNVWSNDG